ncbi:RES domain-containing protein [Burkholderiales bacterium JOSHI_001]|nr:RES domain-containing protein [Burkholderiales bacterium JOSHI_001]
MAASKHFNSWNAFWAFSEAVRFRARFFQDRRVREFLSAVTASAESRVYVLTQGKALWRAQVGHDWKERQQDNVKYDEPVPFPQERMKPKRGSAHEGRVNPRGIPCLYTASNKETAVAEVRPWLGALVSVAQLTPARSLRLVNCGEGHDSKFDSYFEEPSPEIREQAVWRSIGREFSKPVSPDLGAAEYAPTQVLAEYFKKVGYDGVVYKSKLGTGINLAFFDLDVLEMHDVRLYPVKAVSVEIGEVENSYVIKRRKLDA